MQNTSTSSPLFPLHIEFNVNYLHTHYYPMLLSLDDTIKKDNKCPICNGNMEVFSRTRNGNSEIIMEKAVCQSCTYIHYVKVPSSKWFDNYYKNEWDLFRSEPKRYASSVKTYEKNLGFLKEMRLPNDCKIFDMGAGYGVFLHACKEVGYKNLYGIEPSQKRATYCREELGFPVFCSNAETMADNADIVNKGPFDVIHSNHVFEHVNDVNQVLKSAYKILKNGGRLLFSVPSVDSEHFIEVSHSLVHLRNFTKRSISTLFAKNGFRVDYVDSEINIYATKVEGLPESFSPHLELESVKDVAIQLNQKAISDFGLSNLNQSDEVRYFNCRDINDAAPSSQLISSYSKEEIKLIEKKMRWLGPVVLEKPIRGSSGSILNALDLKNVIAKYLKKKLFFQKMEMIGSLKISQGNTNSEFPLIDFIYSSPNTSVGLMK